MTITAQAVKELRERTGAGMMDCRRALEEASGNMDEAVKVLRKKGLAAAAKKAGRTAKEGLVVIATSADGARTAVIELNCETDFVARNERFQMFARSLAQQAAEEGTPDAASLLARPKSGDAEHTVAQAVASEIATIGENMRLSRAAFLAAGNGMQVGSYLHMGGKIGVIVKLSAGADAETVKDVAMHVAAAEPRFVSRDRVPKAVLDEEREVAKAQAEALGKPPQVAEKIAEGKLGKFFEQVCLLEQPFVKNPDQTVAAMLKERGGVVVEDFRRFRLGEGAAAPAEEA
jgi:elongation factor Ts